MVIACVELPPGIVYAAAVAATFTRAAVATVAPTVASNAPNVGNLSGKMILSHLGYSGCEVINPLQICNAVKIIPDFKILDCVLELRVFDPLE